MQSLQNRIVKNLFARFFPSNSTHDLFINAGLLNLEQLHRYRTALFMFKIIKNGWQSQLLLDYLDIDQHDHFTRLRDNLLLPLPRVSCIRINFIYQFMYIWNNIPEFIRNIERIGVFKRELHFYIISN